MYILIYIYMYVGVRTAQTGGIFAANYALPLGGIIHRVHAPFSVSYEQGADRAAGLGGGAHGPNRRHLRRQLRPTPRRYITPSPRPLGVRTAQTGGIFAANYTIPLGGIIHRVHPPFLFLMNKVLIALLVAVGVRTAEAGGILPTTNTPRWCSGHRAPYPRYFFCF